MTRPIPDIETLPPKSEPNYCRGEGARNRCADHCRKSEKIILRLFGPHGRTPHGFYEPLGFVASGRRLASRNRIYSLIVSRLVEHDIARGRMVRFVENGKQIIRLAGEAV